MTLQVRMLNSVLSKDSNKFYYRNFYDKDIKTLSRIEEYSKESNYK